MLKRTSNVYTNENLNIEEVMPQLDFARETDSSAQFGKRHANIITSASAVLLWLQGLHDYTLPHTFVHIYVLCKWKIV